MKKRAQEAKQRDYYLQNDFGDILGTMKPVKLDIDFPSPTQSISIRLSRVVLDKIRILADEQDVPYQSLIKIWLAERLGLAA